MRARAVAGFEPADDFGFDAHTEGGVAGGGEIGAQTARISAGEIAGALALKVDRHRLIVVRVVVLRRQNGVDDWARCRRSFQYALAPRNTNHTHRERARAFNRHFHGRNLARRERRRERLARAD